QAAVSRCDQTPPFHGRLSLHPSHHLDPIGTIAILLIHFGWAKPVRINPGQMRHRLDPAVVAVAGPLTNLLIAIGISIPLKFLVTAPGLGVICADSACFVELALGQAPLDILEAVLAVRFYL